MLSKPFNTAERGAVLSCSQSLVSLILELKQTEKLKIIWAEKLKIIEIKLEIIWAEKLKIIEIKLKIIWAEKSCGLADTESFSQFFETSIVS